MQSKEDPPDLFKEQNASLLNLRSYESDYESIPLRARAPVTSSMKIMNKGTSPAMKNVYHRGTNVERQYDDLYNQNQYYHVTSIVDIHSKQQQQQQQHHQKADQMSASNYSLSSVVFNSDHRESSLTCLNNNESTSVRNGANMPTTSPIYRVNNYENNNTSCSSSRATTPIASITPSGLSGGYQTPLQCLYAQKFNNNKYFNSNQNR